MKDLCDLEELFEARLATIARIGIANTEALAELFGKPSLFNPFLLQGLPLFYSYILCYLFAIICHKDMKNFAIIIIYNKERRSELS